MMIFKKLYQITVLPKVAVRLFQRPDRTVIIVRYKNSRNQGTVGIWYFTSMLYSEHLPIIGAHQQLNTP